MAPMLKVFRADDGDLLLVWQSDSGVWLARLAHADGQTLQLTNPGGRLVELGPSMSEQGALLIPFATRQSVTRLSAYDQMGGLLWSRALDGSRTADASYSGHTVVGIGSSCSGAGEVLDSATGGKS